MAIFHHRDALMHAGLSPLVISHAALGRLAFFASARDIATMMPLFGQVLLYSSFLALLARPDDARGKRRHADGGITAAIIGGIQDTLIYIIKLYGMRAGPLRASGIYDFHMIGFSRRCRHGFQLHGLPAYIKESRRSRCRQIFSRRTAAALPRRPGIFYVRVADFTLAATAYFRRLFIYIKAQLSMFSVIAAIFISSIPGLVKHVSCWTYYLMPCRHT